MGTAKREVNIIFSNICPLFVLISDFLINIRMAMGHFLGLAHKDVTTKH